MHRNTIEFGDTDRQITLVAQGSMWPKGVEVDGEVWERTADVEQVDWDEAVRVYRLVRTKLRSA